MNSQRVGRAFGGVEKSGISLFLSRCHCFILSPNCKAKCSIDESMDWIDLKILKTLEISLHARKWDYKDQGDRDGTYLFQELL